MDNMTVKLDSFSGPLDLLYHLIEKNEIDIYDIPIAELTDQYIEFISREENKNMDGMSEFVVMAASLIEIKSRMLLPKPQTEEPEEDPREELVQKLIEYKKFKNVTEVLAKRSEEAAHILFREPDIIIPELMKRDELPVEAVSYTHLLGDISPKIRTNTVITTVEAVGPVAPPKSSVKKMVARVVEAMFTILFPMSMVESSRS